MERAITGSGEAAMTERLPDPGQVRNLSGQPWDTADLTTAVPHMPVDGKHETMPTRSHPG